MFAVVDIETTGGTARSHRIIEVAIVTVDNGKITDSYSTLINPGMVISPFITALTGITNAMVNDAPRFADVAGLILEKTEGRVFVAHNVNFDYSFLKQEFDVLGIKFDRKKLCTVRLSRKIFPGHKSYGLGTLTGRLGISNNDRHRALGDALATARVLELLIKNDTCDFIGQSLKRTSREATLPSNLPKQIFDQLPEKSGVYYFHDGKGKVIYVGKAKSIKSRVLAHFTGESGSSKRLFHENVVDISYELTGNELIALLLESREIKRLWPEYNRAQKVAFSNHGLYKYADRNGYERFTISKIQPGSRPILNFRSFQEGRAFLNVWVREFRLCPKLCGLQKSESACFDHKIGLCDGACDGDIPSEDYNERVKLALNTLEEYKKTYAIVGAGREPQERSLVLVENGIYLGHGYTDYHIPAKSFEDLKERITPFNDNHDIQKILNSHLKQPNGDQVIYF